ncbi:MAG: DUF308 domain-containing protein [Mediterranea sp.]|jgi:uncharacterized membrane protein HdeD (DUF308 family)|nr:DUF308 domain-containing protein [Mediterranea sp.]
MKTIHYSFLRTVAALILGLVLVLFPAQVGDYLVITVGAVFLIPSLISIIGYFAATKEERPFFPIVGIGCALFGLWLMIMPAFFANVLMFLLSFVLILGGIQEITTLVIARRWTQVSPTFYIAPSLILLTGLITLFYPVDTRNTLFIIIGIATLLYAVSELVNWFMFIRKKPKNNIVVVEATPEEVFETKEEQE